MGMVLFLIVGAILTFGIFCFLCSNTRMISFDGVNGFARGYLDLFIWSVLIAAGIIAGVWYIFGGIFSFIGSVFSAIFGFIGDNIFTIIIAPFVLYCLFGRSPNMKKRKRELDKSDCFEKYVITFKANEDGIKRQELWYFDKNRMVTNGESIMVNAIRITKPDSTKSDLEQFSYRTLLINESNDDKYDYEIGMYGPVKDDDVSMSGLSIKKLEGTKDNLGNMEQMEKIAGGKDKTDLVELYGFQLGENSFAYDLYCFIDSDEMKQYIQKIN